MSSTPTHKKPCTIRDLATHVGLSTCTVSKVLNDPNDLLPIPDNTRRKVREAARRLRYAPNVHAQRFFRRKSFMIGLLVPPQEAMGRTAFFDTHFADLFAGIERALKDTPFNLMFLFNRPEYCDENRYHDLFASNSIDGLLIWGIRRSDRYWNELTDLKGPRIFLASAPEGRPAAPVHAISSDYEQSAFGIARRLLAAGRRNFGWLAGKKDTSIIEQLTAGMRRAGVDIPEALIRYGDYDEDEGARHAVELRDAGCDALFATAPQLARGAQRAVGEDMPIGCFDGQRWTRRETDRYVTAMTNDVEIGRLAVERLIALMDGAEDSVRIRVPVDFSTDEHQ